MLSPRILTRELNTAVGKALQRYAKRVMVPLAIKAGFDPPPTAEAISAICLYHTLDDIGDSLAQELRDYEEPLWDLLTTDIPSVSSYDTFLIRRVFTGFYYYLEAYSPIGYKINGLRKGFLSKRELLKYAETKDFDIILNKLTSDLLTKLYIEGDYIVPVPTHKRVGTWLDLDRDQDGDPHEIEDSEIGSDYGDSESCLSSISYQDEYPEEEELQELSLTEHWEEDSSATLVVPERSIAESDTESDRTLRQIPSQKYRSGSDTLQPCLEEKHSFGVSEGISSLNKFKDKNISTDVEIRIEPKKGPDIRSDLLSDLGSLDKSNDNIPKINFRKSQVKIALDLSTRKTYLPGRNPSAVGKKERVLPYKKEDPNSPALRREEYIGNPVRDPDKGEDLDPLLAGSITRNRIL